MSSPKSASPIDQAALALRQRALATAPGELIGSEDDIVQALGVSRVTVRQAARLLEREGVLFVKRGKKGGYFSARPSVAMVEEVVCAYLDTLGISASHTGGVATALWVEAVREATCADRGEARKAAADLTALIEGITPDATMAEIGQAEAAFRSRVFDLIGGDYMRTIFQINAAFARRTIQRGGPPADPEHHRRFVRKWCSGKLLQAEAIAGGDSMQGVLAALHERRAWDDRRIYAEGRAV